MSTTIHLPAVVIDIWIMTILASFIEGHANGLPVFIHKTTCNRVGSGEDIFIHPVVPIVDHMYFMLTANTVPLIGNVALARNFSSSKMTTW